MDLVDLRGARDRAWNRSVQGATPDLRTHPWTPRELARKAIIICDLDNVASAPAFSSTRVMSTDEKTGRHTLGQAQPTKHLRPGSIERIAFESVPHGTLTPKHSKREDRITTSAELV